MTDKAKPETTRQYGVKYPDGRSFWITGDIARTAGLPGAYNVGSLASATDRGKFIDDWRTAVSSCGLDPDTVPKPQFISRDIIKSFGETVEVND